jgi:hypothetical protein
VLRGGVLLSFEAAPNSSTKAWGMRIAYRGDHCMPDGAGWRSEESTDYLDDVQRSGFAWEFLRRDPLYRQDYQEMSLLLDSQAPSDQEVALALAKRWGLNFSE